MALRTKQQPTYLKVFIENLHSNDSINTPTKAQYCIISITPNSSAPEVCKKIARKRNVQYSENIYELVMVDSDGQTVYETILNPTDKPYKFQQAAEKHGHLGDFHFVFRKSNTSDIDEDDSEPDDTFDHSPQQTQGKFPAAWMEIRSTKNSTWRRRYFVLMNDELLYYKRRDVYERNKQPVERIPLLNPTAIIKKLPQETENMFLFHIDTPKKIYTVRVEHKYTMMDWVRALSKKNESNDINHGLDVLIQESELLHSNNDELIMDKFNTLETILNDQYATDAYMKYLQSIHNEEFVLFWVDVKKYIKDYEKLSVGIQKRFAMELYSKYIKSGAKYELSEIKSKYKREVKKQMESGMITRDIFNEVKSNVFDVLNRDSYKFFDSSEYFKFIITHDDTVNEEQLEWPMRFEEKN